MKLSVICVCLFLTFAIVESVNPASDAGLNITPTPWYAGQAQVAGFNSGTGPRNVALYFDNSTAAYYNTVNVLVYSSDTLDGVQFIGSSLMAIYVQATVSFGPTWSVDESSPVILDLHSGSSSYKLIPLFNTGVNATYSVYDYSYYYFNTGDTFRIFVQYASSDAPQFSNFFVSVIPYSG